MPRIWDDLLSEHDRAVYANAGYGGHGGGGQRPALIVIDVTYDFVGERPEPVLESIKKFPNSCGERGWRSMDAIRDLLAVCREQGVPIFYTRAPSVRSALARGAWGWKKTNESTRGELANRQGNEFPDLVVPRDGETIIEKTKPSAFFGTPLLSFLVALGVDTLVVTGSTTSGCVRATVLDSFSNNLHTIVVEEGVFDRADLPHRANLFDMQAKYADVFSLEQTIGYLNGLRAQTLVSSAGTAGRTGAGSASLSGTVLVQPKV
jgi:nicotinamidase-related amidase